MKELFDQGVLKDNITYLLDKQGKRVGELENYVEVSRGYVSRINKEDSPKPVIDFVMGVADYFNVMIDDLLKVNLSQITQTEYKVINFLKKLLEQTKKDNLRWIYDELDEEPVEETDHPLFSWESTFTRTEFDEYPQPIDVKMFKSRTYSSNTRIAGPCYNLTINKGVRVYLMKVKPLDERLRSEENKGPVIEMWMLPQKGEQQFVTSTLDRTEIASLVEKLYMAIGDSIRHPGFYGELDEAIDEFLSTDIIHEHN